MKTKELLDRVRVSARVVVQRGRVSASELATVLQLVESEIPGEECCDLEVGGAVVARGRIVRRGGRHWFVVREMAKEEKR